MFNTFRSQLNNVSIFNRGLSKSQLFKSVFLFPIEYNFLKQKVSFPIAINFLATFRCNLNCKICHFQNIVNKGSYRELGVAQLENFFKKIAFYQPLLTVEGGEPFTRKDILDIIGVIKSLKLSCIVYSNAVLWDEQTINKLIKLNIEYIVSSVHGPEDVHDSITGVRGSFKATFRNLEQYCRGKNKNSRVFLNLPVTKLNLSFLEGIVEKAKDIGVDAVKLQHLGFMTKLEVAKHSRICNFYGRGQELKSINNFVLEDMNKYVPSIQEIKGLINMVQKKHTKFVCFQPYLSSRQIEWWYSEGGSKYRGGCLFVWRSTFIKPNGDVIPCQYYPEFLLGNILESDFGEIWQSEKYKKLRKALRNNILSGCIRCCRV